MRWIVDSPAHGGARSHLASGGEPEVDFVLTIGTRRVPIEVKYQSTVDPQRDPLGLRRFMAIPSNQAHFGLLVTRDDATYSLEPNIVALPLSTLMLLR